MYEELVKRLRYCAIPDNQCSECKYHGGSPDGSKMCLDVLMEDAADAIEELSREYESVAASLNESVELVRKLQQPRWVSVNERLPKAYEEVTLRFPNNQAAGFCDRDGCWAVYSGDGFYTEVADNEPKPTHWMKKLPEPPEEETPAKDTNVTTTYDLLYEEGGCTSNGV